MSELLDEPQTDARKRPLRISDSVAWLKQRTDEVQAKAEQKVAHRPVEIFLRGMDAFRRAMPNQLAISSLFAPIARGRRQFLNEMPLVTRGNTVMSYTGEQLDEADADIVLQLIFEARTRPLGMPVTVNRAALLRAIGRHTSTSQYQWLMKRITAFAVSD